MDIKIMPDKAQMGKAAAADGAEHIRRAIAERGDANIIVAELGKTGGDVLVIDDKDRVAIAKLRAAYEDWFPKFMAGEEIPVTN